MAAGAEERTIRLASIVAVDIVGFSTMSERDQRNAARKVEALRSRIIEVAKAHNGRLFNTAGDGFMLEFGSAGAALGAVQDILDKRSKGEPPIRVGAHVGDVVVTDTNDLLGHGVNVAARLQALAGPGTALVSAEFRSMAQSSPGAFQSRGQKPLDNIQQRVQTFEILSKRQRFIRTLRRTLLWTTIAVLLGAAAFFAPTMWRMYQAWRAPPAVEQQATQIEAFSPQPQAPQGPRPGDTLRDCPNCPEMVVIDGGLFQMGSPSNEPGRNRDEGPQREVSIAPFAISRTEVTFAQWDACLGGGGCGGFSPMDQGWGRGNQPVVGVTWQQTQQYLDWLNDQAGGLRYRLPTEAEWEYVARAGATTAYAFGARITTRQATFRAQRPDPVGSHPANAFGVFDMHGNVGEWVEDCYAPNYQLAPIDGGAVRLAPCPRRVIRGGSYLDREPPLRAAARRSARPNDRAPSTGFRVVRTL
ncbi:MAG: SUMF1/EgtB/PvdO family nonheme iron enzyme [Hyphomonadaceae bacterium]|nr:SUMF1/EgtB/PvdO family nonheme iron enzyme [Hyphomonadaceae bacterium]